MKSYQELGHINLGTCLRQLAEQVSQDAVNIYQNFDFKIDPKWFPVFYVLASKDADSVVNIAKEINQSHVSVSKIVKEMKSADLIASRKSDKDSRVTLIKLNERARAMVPAMEEQCQAVDNVISQLTSETGINLSQALLVTQQQLKYQPLSERIENETTKDSIRIIDYAPAHQEAYKDLNVEWISQHWQLETPDHLALDNPKNYILDKGGVILIALFEGTPVGCCALIKMDDKTYELAKMAVSPLVQGKGIGISLGKKIIERAKLIGAKRLYLESNSVLSPALNLYSKLGFTDIKGATSPYERCDVQMELFI